MKYSRQILAFSFYSFLVLGTGLLACGCGSDDAENGGNGGDSSLIGVWELFTVNGQNLVPGVWLRWEITATTVTVTSDMDCVEVIRYDASNGQLVGLEMVSQTGTQCGPPDDDPVLGTYTVTENTLTVVIPDPGEIPPTATFVFVRVE
jgi:hypothetical protein